MTGSGDWRSRGLAAGGARQLGLGAVRAGARTGRMVRRLGDPAGQVMAVALSPDGRWVAAGCGIEGGKGLLRLGHGRPGRPLWSRRIRAVRCSRSRLRFDGSAATAAADGVVRVRESRTGRAGADVGREVTGSKA